MKRITIFPGIKLQESAPIPAEAMEIANNLHGSTGTKGFGEGDSSTNSPFKSFVV